MPLARKNRDEPNEGAAAPLASAASDQVRAILEAAESAAASITGEAQAEAERIRAHALAGRQEDLSGVLATVRSLRDAAQRLNADLAALQEQLAAVEAGVAEEAKPLAESPAPASVAKPAPPARKPVAAVAAPAPAAAQQAEADAEGARLIALNMALNGQSREEADRYLAENFDLGDRSGLLDEVFASVEG